MWDAFTGISAGRTYGMSGGNPLAWQDILAWCNLTGVVLSSWELDTLRALDTVWLKAAHSKTDAG